MRWSKSEQDQSPGRKQKWTSRGLSRGFVECPSCKAFPMYLGMYFDRWNFNEDC